MTVAHRHRREPISDQGSIEAVEIGWLKATKRDPAKRRPKSRANDRAIAVDRLWTAPQRLKVLDPPIQEVPNRFARAAVCPGVDFGDEASERRFERRFSAVDSPDWTWTVTPSERVSAGPGRGVPTPQGLRFTERSLHLHYGTPKGN